jgi:hypothetical protein
MSKTEISVEKRIDGWWISLVLHWALLFSLSNVYGLFGLGNWGLRWAHLFPPNGLYARLYEMPHRIMLPYWHGARIAVQWFATHAFGFLNPRGQFWGLDIDVLGFIPLALIWTIFDRRNRNNVVVREIIYFVVRYQLATMMFLYGSAKLIGLQGVPQGIPQPTPLEWVRPLGEISSGQVMMTWLGYSPIYRFFAGVNETLGAILLLFRRTTLLGSLLILSVMAFVTALDLTYHIGPAASAALYGVGAFYLIAREWRRLAGVFLFGEPTAPTSPRKLWTSPRVALVGRGLWVVLIAYSLWSYVLPQVKMKADVGGRQSALCGVYQVERFVSDGRLLPEEDADPARWREAAIDCFGDYIRIRRMDDAELLWAADPGDPYRFMVATGHDYKYGDYAKILTRTARMDAQLRFRELPNYASPHIAVPASSDSQASASVSKPNYSSGRFFIVNFVRQDSDHVSLRGRIDGAEISADLVRIKNDDF